MKTTLRDLWIDQEVTTELYNRFIDPVCQKYGVSRIEFGILSFISRYPQFNRAADIVKYKGLSKSYVSLSIKSLTEKGFLEGHKNENDHKNIYLYLLPACNALIKEGEKAQKEFCATIYDGFEKEEIDAFFSALKRITENAKKSSTEQTACSRKRK